MTADALPNNVIRGVREVQFRMSREEFARLVNTTAAATGENTGCTARLVAAWERGEVTSPRPVYERVLHELTGRGLAELGFRPRRTATVGASEPLGPAYSVDGSGLPGGSEFPSDVPSSGSLESGTLEDMIRREFLRLVGVAGAFVSVPRDGEASAADMASAQDLQGLGTFNNDLWRVYGMAATKQSVYPLVREQLVTLTAALRNRRGLQEHRALCNLLGDTAQLAGEIWFDANRYTEAAHCYALAADAAKEAGNRDLWACALVRHSFISFYARRYDEALPLLEAAESLARHGDGQLATRHWVASVRAQTLAGLGDAEGCNQALDEAAAIQGLAVTVPGGWLRFAGDRLAEERGSAYMALGRLELAEQSLATALAESLSPRRRGSVLTDLAVIGARRRDVDRLVEHGTSAADLAQRTRSGYMARRLHGLRNSLTPFLSDRRVRELSDRMETLGVRA